MSDDVGSRIAEVVRQEWPRLVATLMRDFGDLGTAEDAAQEAAEVALTAWLDDGIPDRPGAWITTVARRRALDRLRREKTGRAKLELLGRLEERVGREDTPAEVERALRDDASLLRDDQLRLFFGCCHPALSIEAQMALTLRSVGGLTTVEIARGFLVAESTMAQRLVRAKRKIASAAIPFRIPDDAALLGRLGIVHHVLYLVFNEGYAPSLGDRALRPDLSNEAIRLTRLLADLVADDSETLGLLALMLLIDSRRSARVSATGEAILLEDQDHRLWDQAMIAEGTSVLDRAMRLAGRGPYQIEAAIHALHVGAPTSAETDWPQIAALYEALTEFRPTPVVALNRAVAVAFSEGPAAGLAMMNDPAVAEPLDGYRYLHSARADLLRRMGSADSIGAYERALELTENTADRVFLERRIVEARTAFAG